MNDTLEGLADELSMLASQIAESARDEGDAPHPWVFDDWLNRYRTLIDIIGGKWRLGE